MAISHNIGIAQLPNKSAICYSVWLADKDEIVIRQLWSVDSVSTKVILNKLTDITSKWSAKRTHHCYLYIADEAIKPDLKEWFKGRQPPDGIRIREPIGKPKTLMTKVLSGIEDETISIASTMNTTDLAMIDRFVRGVSEDDKGKAKGQAEAIALLLAVGEPIYLRSTGQEDLIGRNLGKIHQGSTRETQRLVDDFSQPDRGWWY